MTRNDADRLETTLASLASQVADAAQWELVVADGMSTDRTVTVLTEWLDKLPTLRVERQDDSGIYDAMNKALRIARGKYVLFLNCGDILACDGALALLVDAAAATATRWLVFDIRNLRGRGLPKRMDMTPFRVYRFLVGKQAYCHQACMFRRDALAALGGFDLAYDFMADYDLILKFAIAGPPTALGRCLVDYEGGGISAARASEIPLIMHEVRRDRFNLEGLPLALSRGFAVLQTSRRFGFLRSVPPRVRRG